MNSGASEADTGGIPHLSQLRITEGGTAMITRVPAAQLRASETAKKHMAALTHSTNSAVDRG
jgi:hypothetical protein